MLGLQGTKGTLDPGADADLVILSERDFTSTGTGTSGFEDDGTVQDGNGGGSGLMKGGREVVVEEVWKFGVRIYKREAGKA